MRRASKEIAIDINDLTRKKADDLPFKDFDSGQWRRGQ
jgi:hypothetical protein